MASNETVTERSAWREAARSVFSFDGTKVDAAFALRCTIGVAAPFAIAAATGSLVDGVAAATGALSTGFASLQGVYRTRAATMLLTAAGMAFATLLGGLTGGSAVASILVTALFGYCYGVVASLGPAATAVGLNSTVALVLFGHLGLGWPQTIEQAALVFAGGALQTVLLVLVWPLGRYEAERRSLAGAYRRLALDARALARGTLALPDASAIVTVRDTLADPRPFARRGDVEYFAALLDEAERVRAGLATLAHMHGTQSRATLDACAAALDEIATSLTDGRAPYEDASVWDTIERHERGVETRDVHALLGRVRAAWRTASAPASQRPSLAKKRRRTRAFPALPDTLATLRANVGVDSPYGRLAIRLAFTLGIADALSRAFAIERGYWMVLTAALLLRPDFTTTVSRGVARVAGTLAGAGLSGAIALGLHPLGHADIALCVLFAGIGYLVFNANYGLFTVTITAFVVFAFSVLGESSVTATAERLVSTLYGSALAAIATLVWPTWETRRTRDALADLVEADRAYAATLLGLYERWSGAARRAVDAAQSAAWAARTSAEASVDRLLLEPARVRTVDRDAALGMLAASRRFAIALLAINARSSTARHVERPALAPFRNALDAALRTTIGTLRGTSVDEPHAPLRDAFFVTRHALESSAEGDARDIVPDLDALVDAANSLRELAERARP